jgi:hypothetical protein
MERIFAAKDWQNVPRWRYHRILSVFGLPRSVNHSPCDFAPAVTPCKNTETQRLMIADGRIRRF